MKHKYPIVVLSYIDVSYYGGVYNAKTKKFTSCVVNVVGHVLHENDKEITIAQEYYSDDDTQDEVRYVGVVPKVSLLSKEILYEP